MEAKRNKQKHQTASLSERASISKVLPPHWDKAAYKLNLGNEKKQNSAIVARPATNVVILSQVQPVTIYGLVICSQNIDKNGFQKTDGRQASDDLP